MQNQTAGVRNRLYVALTTPCRAGALCRLVTTGQTFLPVQGIPSASGLQAQVFESAGNVLHTSVRSLADCSLSEFGQTDTFVAECISAYTCVCIFTLRQTAAPAVLQCGPLLKCRPLLQEHRLHRLCGPV